jgi:RsiW-degrading membrane proteinase PrsW (M82 family)
MFLLLFVSIFPILVLLGYFYFRDKYEKEPFLIMLKAFFGGALSSVATILFFILIRPSLPVFNDVVFQSFYTAFFLAAIPEEFFKFLFLYWFIWKNKNFNEYYDGILYAVFVSLGFACLENIGYVFQYGIATGIGRAFLAVPGHALHGVIMGYYFSLAKFIPENRKKYLLKSLFLPILTHGVWDFITFLGSGFGEISALAALLMVIAFSIFLINLYKICLKKIELHVEASCFKNSQSTVEIACESTDADKMTEKSISLSIGSIEKE